MQHANTLSIPVPFTLFDRWLLTGLDLPSIIFQGMLFLDFKCAIIYLFARLFVHLPCPCPGSLQCPQMTHWSRVIHSAPLCSTADRWSVSVTLYVFFFLTFIHFFSVLKQKAPSWKKPRRLWPNQDLTECSFQIAKASVLIGNELTN